MVYRYKGNTHKEVFNRYDSALDLIDKIKNSKIKLAKEKNDQVDFKSSLGEIKKEKKQKRIIQY